MAIRAPYPCLWFEKDGLIAAQWYCSLFPDSRIVDANPTVVQFELFNQAFMILNGGPHFVLNEAVSLVVECETQEEIDHYWTALLSNGGRESRCGWLKDRYGLSWQIIPHQLGQWANHPNRKKAERMLQAMSQMVKMNIAELEAAFNQE